MKSRTIIASICILALWATAAVAASPVASPENVIGDIQFESLPQGQKAFGDPTDLKAAVMAGAQYLRAMHADVTEDNALNGLVDDDLQDAGWDWNSTIFQHSANASPSNLHGVIANSLFRAYLLEPTPELFTVMQDVADHSLLVGPAPAYPVGLHYPGDIKFLLNFATLPGVTNAPALQAHAVSIWDWRIANTGGGTAAGIASGILTSRSGQGYENGIGPWDVSAYVEAAIMLHAVFPGDNYDVAAADMAEVLYQDSYMLAPGYFDFDGRCKGYTTDYSNTDYYWYGLGIQGLITSFQLAGIHTAEIPTLEGILLECQYDDGAFGDQYGAPLDVNTRDWQTSAYATLALADYAADTTTNRQAIYKAGVWMATYQDASGGFLYSSGTHYPEIGAECTAAMAAAYALSAPAITASAAGPDPVQCGQDKVVTFNYAPQAGTPGLRAYELTLEVTGPVNAFTEVQFVDAGLFDGFSNQYFHVVDNDDGTWTVNDAILGDTTGLMAAGDMFTLTLHTNGNGAVDVNVLSYKMRDPDNAEIFGAVSGTSFVVDCSAPGSVDSFVGAPGHEKAILNWSMADVSDVANFEIWRSLWYDNGNPYVSAYPEYDDLAQDMLPTRPADRAAALASGEWTLVNTALAGELAWTDPNTVRGIYFYEIFTMDAAGNYGPPAMDPVGVMNYWLGDVSDGTPWQFDGEVDPSDITTLGSFFGLSNIGLNHPGHQVDVGPTHDNSRLGIPETDDQIDFEDLMIFAMNFNVVSAAKGDNTPGSMAYLGWERLEDGRYAISVEQANGLKGLHVVGSSNVNGVSAGALIAEQSEMTFMTNVGSQLDANVAVMGLDVSFSGQGELLIINAVGELSLEDLVFTARGMDNSEMEISFTQATGAIMPTVFSLGSNYPNPFNPMTKISFSLPEAQNVKLTVYGLDGRKVATLVNESFAAGNHDVVWTGRNDQNQNVASGTYFYRINAGPYSEVRKMTLMK